MPESFILSIDQGTSGTKAIVFDIHGNLICKAVTELKSQYPQSGYVEQDPFDIYNGVISAVEQVILLFKKKYPDHTHAIECCGISNQRETFLVWDADGAPISKAVVWQCKRSVDICEFLKNQGLESSIRAKTGLTIDPYFSASKMMWLAQNDSDVQSAIAEKNAFFGTIDTWLLYKLTAHKTYATDHTNASRTLLYNIFELDWDQDLIKEFGLNGLKFPEVRSSDAHFGNTDFNAIFEKEIPITGIIGDSHAAFFGEACFEKGMAKATLGTGSSVMLNAGNAVSRTNEATLSTVGWSIKHNINYAYEGVIVSCGATLEWLKNQLGLFLNHDEIEPMAKSLNSNEGVYLIPAFSGMGAPHWQKHWKASIHGLSFDTTKAHLVRAALESIAFQLTDVIEAIENETQIKLKELKVDGGMTANAFLMQLIADALQKTVTSIGFSDVSAYGAALVAGLGQDIYANTYALPKLDPSNTTKYHPNHENFIINEAYKTWCDLLKEKRI